MKFPQGNCGIYGARLLLMSNEHNLIYRLHLHSYTVLLKKKIISHLFTFPAGMNQENSHDAFSFHFFFLPSNLNYRGIII